MVPLKRVKNPCFAGDDEFQIGAAILLMGLIQGILTALLLAELSKHGMKVGSSRRKVFLVPYLFLPGGHAGPGSTGRMPREQFRLLRVCSDPRLVLCWLDPAGYFQPGYYFQSLSFALKYPKCSYAFVLQATHFLWC